MRVAPSESYGRRMLHLWIFRDENGNELARHENAYPPPPSSLVNKPFVFNYVRIIDYQLTGQAARDLSGVPQEYYLLATEFETVQSREVTSRE